MCSGAGSIRPICWRCSPCFCGNDNAAAIITTSTTPGELSPQHALVFALALCSEGTHGDFLPVWVCLATWYLASRTLGGRNAMALVFQLVLAFILLFPDLLSERTDGHGLHFVLTLSPLTAVSAVLFVFALCRWKRLHGWDIAFAASGVLLYFLGTQRELFGQLVAVVADAGRGHSRVCGGRA